MIQIPWPEIKLIQTELTKLKEITEFIRGINFIGKSKWKEI